MRLRLLIAVPVLAVMLSLAQNVRAEDEHPVVKLVKSKVKDVKKPFSLIVEFKVKAGKEKEATEAFAPCLIATRKEPGCVVYFLNRDPDHPEMFIMYEQFKSVDALAAHLKEKHTQTLLKTLGELGDGEPKLKILIPE
ncbi:MAG: antibiotic biosynthesis monooxygenase [Planctomycetes bacterium]|nr:antibiotic biosynthesis monooxygenase [Planctomycetota bacterium]